MSHKVRYDTANHIIRVHMSGEVAVDTIQAYLKESFRLMEKHNCFRIVCDAREANLSLSTMQVFDLPSMVDECGLKPDVKRALVAKSHSEINSFFETVSRNRGQQVQVFTSIDDAIAWLKE